MVALSITQNMTTQTEVAGMSWQEWQEFLESIEGCTCKPDGDACPACTRRIDAYYDGEIPFEFGGNNA